MERVIDAALAARFWAKVEKSDDCWIWTGGHNSNGYGIIRIADRTVLAHRVAFEDAWGTIPDGLVLDHLCRTRDCVRPDHMEVVTNAENILRGEGAAAVHARRTHCPHGHPYDEANTYVSHRGWRECRICKRATLRAHRERRRARRA